jgi:glycosyltransferase involved in cell wall biosynthesis
MLSNAPTPPSFQPQSAAPRISDLSHVRVAIIRLRDPRYDARIERIARSLVKAGCLVDILYLPARQNQSPLEWTGVRGTAINPVSRRVPGRAGLLLKFMEFAIRAAVAAFRTKADVYSAGTTDALLIAYIVGRLRGARVVYEAQELYPYMEEIPARRVWFFLEKWLLPKVEGITAANNERAAVMQEEYQLTRTPQVITNCPPKMDPDNVAKIQWKPAGSTEKRHIVLYQGSIADGRGLLNLIRSVRLLDESTQLALVGPAEDSFARRARQLAEDEGVSGRILWYGPVPRTQLDSYTVSADVGVVFYEPTCRNNYLCAPNKLYDYLMAGLPMVASDLPEIRRVLSETRAGIVVNSAEPESIAAGILELLATAEVRLEYSRKAREAATRRYCWEIQEQELLGFYQEALGRPR